jgi:hypothetical protein
VSAIANTGGFAMGVYLIFKIIIGPIVFGIYVEDMKGIFKEKPKNLDQNMTLWRRVDRELTVPKMVK